MPAFEMGLEIAILILIGFIIRKAGFLPKDFNAALSAFVINVSLPCVILSSMNIPFDPDEVRGMLVLAVMGAVMTAAFLLLGHVGYLISGRGGAGRLIRFGTAFPNYTYMGFPVMQTLFGDVGLFRYSIFSMPVRTFIYIVARLNFTGGRNEKLSARDTFRQLLTMPVAAMAIGLVIYLFNIRLPPVIGNVLSDIGATASPLGMFICGMSLADADLKKLLHAPKMLILVALRNLIAPALTLGVLICTGINSEYIKIAVIYAALPVAAITTAFTIQYERSDEAVADSSIAVLLSTIVSIGTLPVFSALLELIYP